jgi:hypothetical protein
MANPYIQWMHTASDDNDSDNDDDNGWGPHWEEDSPDFGDGAQDDGWEEGYADPELCSTSDDETEQDDDYEDDQEQSSDYDESEDEIDPDQPMGPPREVLEGGEECPHCLKMVWRRLWPLSCAEWQGFALQDPRLCTACNVVYVCKRCAVQPPRCCTPNLNRTCDRCNSPRTLQDLGTVRILAGVPVSSFLCHSCDQEAHPTPDVCGLDYKETPAEEAFYIKFYE